jgi:hypothetical protein
VSILISSILSGLLACTQHKKEENVSGPIRVQIPFSMDGNYSLKVIELVTLENLVELKGLAARFLIDPDSSKGKLNGRSPELKYLKDDQGIIVPTDNLSLQLLTVYAHFEKMRELDQKLGVADKLVWPATVAINAKYKTSDGVLVNNALYSGEHDALLVVPYVGDDLPIMVNAGVLGHEHFHNIFQKLVLGPIEEKAKQKPGSSKMTIHDEKKLKEIFHLAEEPSTTQEPSTEEPTAEAIALKKLYHEVLMRGINEGFADVWGWVYSGDDSFVGKSLPNEKSRRQLNVTVASIASVKEIKDQIQEFDYTDQLIGYSYQLGTQYARMMRNFAEILSETKGLSLAQTRNEIGSLILKVLPLLEQKYENLSEEDYLDPNDIIEMLLNSSDKLDAKQCFYLNSLLSNTERKESGKKRCQDLESNSVVLTEAGD